MKNTDEAGRERHTRPNEHIFAFQCSSGLIIIMYKSLNEVYIQQTQHVQNISLGAGS